MSDDHTGIIASKNYHSYVPSKFAVMNFYHTFVAVSVHNGTSIVAIRYTATGSPVIYKCCVNNRYMIITSVMYQCSKSYVISFKPALSNCSVASVQS